MRRIITEWTPEHLPTINDIVAIYGWKHPEARRLVLAAPDAHTDFISAGRITNPSGHPHDEGHSFSAVALSYTDTLTPTPMLMERTIIQIRFHTPEGEYPRVFTITRRLDELEAQWYAYLLSSEAECLEASLNGLVFDCDTEEEAA